MEKQRPLVSVVVPAYNEEGNIERLVKSVRAQSYGRVEVLVVDDGSTDATVELARSVGAMVFQRKHAERSIQRNFGVKKAKGEYLMILDADMELTKDVVLDCVSLAEEQDYKVLVIPEKTVVTGLITRIRAFEREMYMGDMGIEVARFFEKKAFLEFHGYDPNLTGPEDYDLPYRMGKKYPIGRAKKYILHHEAGKSLWSLLKRKYKYAKEGAKYAEKHPELVRTQGNLLFRAAYFRNWRKFVHQPVLGIAFVCVRILEMMAAVIGYASTVGIGGFLKSLCDMIRMR